MRVSSKSSVGFIERLLDRPRLAAGLCILLMGALASGAGGLKLNASYSAYFDPSDPLLAVHQQLASEFHQADNAAVILQFAPGQSLSEPALGLLHSVVSAIESLPEVDIVRSVLDLSRQTDAAPESDPLLAELLDLEPVPPSGPRISPEQINADPRGEGIYVSRDKSALLLEVAFDLPPTIPAPVLLETLQRLRATVAQTIGSASMASPPTVRYTGPLLLNEAYINVVRHDLKLFLPALVSAITIVLGLMFGSFKIALAMQAAAMVAVLGAFGGAGWAGAELAAIDAFAPIIIASLTLAGGVHLVSRFVRHYHDSGEYERAMRQSLHDNLLPLALTNLTTAAGFAALSFSPTPPIRVMGWLVAGGIFLGWLCNLVLLPWALRVLSNQLPAAKPASRLIVTIRAIAEHRSRLVLWLFGIAMGVALLFAAGNRIDDSVFDYFPDSHSFSRDTRYVAEQFSGINTLAFALGTDVRMGVFDRDLLERVRAFAAWARSQPEVRQVIALTDIDAVARNLDGADPEQAIQRYRALASAHTPAGLGAERLINADFSALAIHLYLARLSANQTIDFERRARSWLIDHAGGFVARGGGGTNLVFAHLGQRNARSMIVALGGALVIISLLCGALTRSARGACVGLLCNLFPVLLVYAFWAVIDGHISMGAAVVLGMILGIIVDDTIYLLTHFWRFSQQGRSAPAWQAVATVGPALIITTLTLGVGLSTGMLSAFAPIAAMSGLSVAVITVALATDLIVLPSLLSAGRRPPINPPRSSSS